MRRETSDPNPVVAEITRPQRYEPPRYELIQLACEISAYAPDSDLPLF